MNYHSPRSLALLAQVGLIGIIISAPTYASAPPKPAPAPLVQLQAPLDSRQSAGQESSLGDLIADAMRASAQTDFALVPADEMTPTVLAVGQVPAAQIVHTLHYSGDPADTIVILKLTGKQIYQALDRSMSRIPQPFDGFLQISGFLVHLDPSAQTAAARIVAILPNGATLQPDHSYRVAVPHALAEGGLGYFQVWPDKKSWEQETNVSLATALTNYLKLHPTLNVPGTSRITTHGSEG